MTSHHIVTLYITDICLFELLGLLEMLSLLEVHVLLEMLYLIEVLCLPEVLAYLELAFLSNFAHHCTEFLYVFICFKVHYR